MDDLFDYLETQPDGVTIEDIEAHLACGPRHAREAVHDLRAFLGNTDEAWVTCTPQGPRDRWLYSLTSGARAVDPETPEGRWVVNRVGDCEARIGTMLSAMRTAVRGTSRGTVLGQKARVLARALGRLQEDLEDVDGRL